MKNKALIRLLATATIGTAMATPAMMNSQNTTKIVNKMLMTNNINNSSTNEAVVVKGNSNINLYELSNGSGIISNLSTGEMLTLLGKQQGNFCKVRVQETGAVGYINVVNMQSILNGTKDSFTQLSRNGQIINVSSNVRLRSNPSIGNNIIGHLTNRTSLNILGKQGQWYKVSVNGQTGFIYEEYVSTIPTNNTSHSTIVNNINANSGNINTSTTSTNHSNVTKNTNLTSSINSTSNISSIKNIITRIKSLSISNVSSNINSNKSSKVGNNSIKKSHNSLNTSQNSISANKGTNRGKNIQGNSNTTKFANLGKVKNGKVVWNNISLIPNNTTGKIVNTNPNTSCEILNIPSSAGQALKIINKKSVPLKVLGQVVEREHGTQNHIIWYKVKTSNGLVGYVNQSLTYSTLCYTNPDYKINILNTPYTSGSVLKTISYKEEPIYVINQVTGISPKINQKEYYFEVSYDNGFTGFINIHDLLNCN